MADENKQAWGDVDLSLLDGMNPYDLFLKDPSKRKFGPKLTKALEDARREGFEEGWREGFARGRREATMYNIVSKMLAKGADWQVIEEFTSVDEARYRELARDVACIKDPVPD